MERNQKKEFYNKDEHTMCTIETPHHTTQLRTITHVLHTHKLHTRDFTTIKNTTLFPIQQ